MKCRLCAGPTAKSFNLEVLNRYDIVFFECTECKSLQSEPPYWLAEAYRDAITSTDTGVVIRNQMCQAALLVATTTLNIKGTFLDFGGGTGMLCRMLRDRGLDAYVSDRYSDPVYASEFVLDLKSAASRGVGLLSAIEVFEHFENPAANVGELFAVKPRVLLATTVLYRGEGRDWWYIGKHTGQHIFFYTTAGMNFLAKEHGYHYFGHGDIHLFSKAPLTVIQKLTLRVFMSKIGLRFVRVWIAASQRGTYADLDFKKLSGKHPRLQPIDRDI